MQGMKKGDALKKLDVATLSRSGAEPKTTSKNSVYHAGAHSRLLAPLRASGTLLREAESNTAAVLDTSVMENPFACGDVIPVDNLIGKLRQERRAGRPQQTTKTDSGDPPSTASRSSTVATPSTVAVRGASMTQVQHAGSPSQVVLQPLSDHEIAHYLRKLRGSTHEHRNQAGSRSGSRAASPTLSDTRGSRTSRFRLDSRPASPTTDDAMSRTNGSDVVQGPPRPAFLDNLSKAQFIAKAYLKYVEAHGSGNWMGRGRVLLDADEALREKDKARHDVSQMPKDMRQFIRACGVETSLTQDERYDSEAKTFRAKKQGEVAAVRLRAYQNSMNTVQNFLKDVVGIHHWGSGGSEQAVHDALVAALDTERLLRAGTAQGTSTSHTISKRHPNAGQHASVTFASPLRSTHHPQQPNLLPCATAAFLGSELHMSSADAMMKSSGMLDPRSSTPPPLPLPLTEAHVWCVDVCIKWAVLLWSYRSYPVLRSSADGHSGSSLDASGDVFSKLALPQSWMALCARNFPQWFMSSPTCQCVLGGDHDASTHSHELDLVSWISKLLSYATEFQSVCAMGKCPVHVTDDRLVVVIKSRVHEGALCRDTSVTSSSKHNSSSSPSRMAGHKQSSNKPYQGQSVLRVTHHPNVSSSASPITISADDALCRPLGHPFRHAASTSASSEVAGTSPQLALLALPTQQITLKRRLEDVMGSLSSPSAAQTNKPLPLPSMTVERPAQGDNRRRGSDVHSGTMDEANSRAIQQFGGLLSIRAPSMASLNSSISAAPSSYVGRRDSRLNSSVSSPIASPLNRGSRKPPVRSSPFAVGRPSLSLSDGGAKEARRFTLQALCCALPYSSASFLCSRTWFYWLPVASRSLTRSLEAATGASASAAGKKNDVGNPNADQARLRYQILTHMAKSFRSIPPSSQEALNGNLVSTLEADLPQLVAHIQALPCVTTDEIRHVFNVLGDDVGPSRFSDLQLDAASDDDCAECHDLVHTGSSSDGCWSISCSALERAFRCYYAARQKRLSMANLIREAVTRAKFSKEASKKPPLQKTRGHSVVASENYGDEEVSVTQAPPLRDFSSGEVSTPDEEELEFQRQEEAKRLELAAEAQLQSALMTLRDYFRSHDKDGDSAWSFFEFCTACWDAVERYYVLSLAAGGLQPSAIDCDSALITVASPFPATAVQMTQGRSIGNPSVELLEFLLLLTQPLFELPPHSLFADHNLPDGTFSLEKRQQCERRVEQRWLDVHRMNEFLRDHCDAFGFVQSQ